MVGNFWKVNWLNYFNNFSNFFKRIGDRHIFDWYWFGTVSIYIWIPVTCLPLLGFIFFFFFCLSFHVILISERLRDFHFPAHLSALHPAVLVISKSQKWYTNGRIMQCDLKQRGIALVCRRGVFIPGCCS